MLSRQFEAEWERRRHYPRRPPLLEIPVLSPIRESGEPQRYWQSPADRDDGPLPELVVERERKRVWEDETDEYYDQLAKRMRRYYRKLFNVCNKRKRDDATEVEEQGSTDSDMEYVKLLDPSFIDTGDTDEQPEVDANNNGSNRNDSADDGSLPDALDDVMRDVSEVREDVGSFAEIRNLSDVNNNEYEPVTRNVSHEAVLSLAMEKQSTGQSLSETFTVAAEHHDDTGSESTMKVYEARESSVGTSSMDGTTEAGGNTIVVKALVHEPPKEKSYIFHHQKDDEKARPVSKGLEDPETRSSDTGQFLQAYGSTGNRNEQEDVISKGSNTADGTTSKDEFNDALVTTDDSNSEKSPSDTKSDDTESRPTIHHEADKSSVESPEGGQLREKVTVSKESTSFDKTLQADVDRSLDDDTAESRNITLRNRLQSSHATTIRDRSESENETTSDDARSSPASDQETKAQGGHDEQEHTDKIQGSDGNISTCSGRQEEIASRGITQATPTTSEGDRDTGAEENRDYPSSKASGSQSNRSSEDLPARHSEDAAGNQEEENDASVSGEEFGHGANQDGSDTYEEDTDLTVEENRQERLVTILEDEEQDTATRDDMVEEGGPSGELERREIETMRTPNITRTIHSLQRDPTPISIESLSPDAPGREHSLQQACQEPNTSADEALERTPHEEFHPSLKTTPPEVSEATTKPQTLKDLFREYFEFVKRAKHDQPETGEPDSRPVAAPDGKGRYVDAGVQTKESRHKKRHFGVQTDDGDERGDAAHAKRPKMNEDCETSHEYFYSDGTFTCYFKFRKL